MIDIKKYMTVGPTPSRDETYTLVEGETKKNYCKVMFNMRQSVQNQAFTLSLLKKRIMLNARTRKERTYKSGQVRPIRENLSGEEADALIYNMQQQGYIRYLKTQHRDKLHPLIPDEGLKYYIFDQYKVIECQESKYFQAKIRKLSTESETKGKLSEKRCRALRQIYAQFGDKTPFTYNMVIQLPSFYKKIASGELTLEEGEKVKPELKQYYYQAAKNAEARDEDFLNTWNSLIRNNYLIPYQVRAKDGTIKTRQGAFRVNMAYARKCLSLANL